ncbi:late competence development ComFB family protein [Heliobacterium chlorum]|uniref:Late competence development ComFB family protein n=1 Tax=Heliobacterium chlorum TaxID=2698 RepID=A0ABR7T2C3_HELCL|nr:late competence development ComFB family protein [Heliobacterium chlorum]MBC9784918.1 late competence development ComFB family protein [Heliobacterium chlorum]
MLHNLMEDVVLSVLDELLPQHPEVCSCDQCRLDIIAAALNRLPARYVVTSKGEVYSKVNVLISQFRVDVISAIANGMMVVAKNPRHSSPKPRMEEPVYVE